MLQGIDVCHYNWDGEKKALRLMDGKDFVIIKATEGKTFDDQYTDVWTGAALKYGKLLGYYHYARPENNTAKEEADHFIRIVEEYLEHRPILVLDWEGAALNCSTEWALEWLNEVKDRTGCKPFIYVQYSALKQMKNVAEAGFPLWLARYNSEKGDVTPFKEAKIWQYTSSPIDSNRFYGDKEEWLYYAKQEENAEYNNLLKDCYETLDVLTGMIKETRSDIIATISLLDDAAGRLLSYHKTLDKVSERLKAGK